MATSIDDNAADENLYKLFGEMSVIQYTSCFHDLRFKSGGDSNFFYVVEFSIPIVHILPDFFLSVNTFTKLYLTINADHG